MRLHRRPRRIIGNAGSIIFFLSPLHLFIVNDAINQDERLRTDWLGNMTMIVPLPWLYRYFFLTLEPALTFIAAIYSISATSTYFHALIPVTTIHPAPIELHPAASMAIHQLGSCYFLLGLLATFLLRTISHQLQHQPALLERVLSTYLRCLAAADITHVLLTFFDLGCEQSIDIGGWNALIWGNCGITIVLFAGRCCWFSRIGRRGDVKAQSA